MNKSQAIREYAAANAGAGPTAISKALSKGKLQVSPALVSQVLKKKKRKYTRRAAANGVAPEEGITLATILAAKKLVDSVGGVQQAKAAVDMLAKVLG